MVLYAISAVYFAGVMVRLMLTLTPVVCMLSAVAFSALLEQYLRDIDNDGEPVPVGDQEEEQSGTNKYDKVSF